MGQVITIGLDIAKSVFQVHGVDEGGTVVIRRQVRRAHSLRSPASCRPAWSASKPRHGSPLGSRAGRARPPGAAHAAVLREAVRQAAEERRGGC